MAFGINEQAGRLLEELVCWDANFFSGGDRLAIVRDRTATTATGSASLGRCLDETSWEYRARERLDSGGPDNARLVRWPDNMPVPVVRVELVACLQDDCRTSQKPVA